MAVDDKSYRTLFLRFFVFMDPAMLFLTNHRLLEGPGSRAGRRVTFDCGDTEPSSSLFFCRRNEDGSAEELLAGPFLDALRASGRRQILLFLHGFNCEPDADVLPEGLELQRLCDELSPGLVEVVPLIWPCGNNPDLLLDYWDDQATAEVSGYAFSRLLGKFIDWRRASPDPAPCLKHINLLAHSMGNRVLATALDRWRRAHGAVPAVFRSIFMLAPDLPNEALEPGADAGTIPAAARHVLVYYAGDDFALRSSKVANVRNRIVSRRLGHTGPEHLELTSANVVAIDCDAFNSACDPLGHRYFLGDPQGRPGPALRHVVATLATGRVEGVPPGERRLLLEAGAILEPAAA
jgi:esterase/lipase superfamily enzyme